MRFKPLAWLCALFALLIFDFRTSGCVAFAVFFLGGASLCVSGRVFCCCCFLLRCVLFFQPDALFRSPAHFITQSSSGSPSSLLLLSLLLLFSFRISFDLWEKCLNVNEIRAALSVHLPFRDTVQRRPTISHTHAYKHAHRPVQRMKRGRAGRKGTSQLRNE